MVCWTAALIAVLVISAVRTGDVRLLESVLLIIAVTDIDKQRLFKLIARAIVVSITVATPRTKIVILCAFENILTPLAAQIPQSIRPTATGIISVPNAPLAIFLVFEGIMVILIEILFTT